MLELGGKDGDCRKRKSLNRLQTSTSNDPSLALPQELRYSTLTHHLHTHLIAHRSSFSLVIPFNHFFWFEILAGYVK